jgi:transglutaminase-like putative cysteine protease
MNRREFFVLSGTTAAASALPRLAWSAADPLATPWRQFEVVTEVEISPDAGPVKLWLPLPLHQDTDYQRSLATRWDTNARVAGIYREMRYGSPIFYALWDSGAAGGKVQLTTNVATRNRATDLSKPGRAFASTQEELGLYLASTTHIPLDGIVGDTAKKITRRAGNDPLDKPRAIYEWIVDNTFRDPKVRGCGVGDISTMLETGNMGGKCADLNALFVGLARASGIPARDVYGVRVADSATWKSLGKSGDISKAQHCRAEFYHAAYGWVPVDPADVRKVILEEEKGGVPLDHPKVKLAREKLFGSWEMNWMGFNTAGDTRLAPQIEKPLVYFMYPHGETAKGRLDSLDPDNFRYKMTAREVV